MSDFRSVDAVLRPRSLAIVGASESPAARWTKTLFDNLRHFGSTVPVYPVNPRRASVWGERCYPALEDLPEPVDLALMIMPAAAIPATLRAGFVHGLKAATVYAAGFGEANNPAGLLLAEELRALCNDGLRLAGPNCMGAISTRERLYLYPAQRIRDVYPGNVALVMQSGGLCQFWLQQAAARGLGISYAVTTGNQLDLDLADYLNFLVEDEATKVICVLAEGIARPPAFVAAAAKALAARKPILLVKIGRSAAAKQAAQTHTGSLAGDDRVFDAVCERYGIIRVETLDQMIESALVFRSSSLPRGHRVAMVGYSGASRGLALDSAELVGIEFSRLTEATSRELHGHVDPGTSLEMPLDLGTGVTTDPERFSRICQIVGADPNVALMAVQAQLPVQNESPDPTWHRAIVTSTSKPVFAYSRTAQNVLEAGRAFQADVGMAFIQGIPETMIVAKQLIRYAQHLERVTPPSAPPVNAGGTIDDAFRRHGLKVPLERVATTVDETLEAAARIGYPVALKLHSPAPIHKTEVEGVVLGLREASDVRRAADRLFATIAAHPDLACDGLLIQEMVSGVEMIVGAHHDRQFGPVMMLGLGGIFVEAFDDLALRLLPLDTAGARGMIDALRGKTLLGTFRGRAERDTEALVSAIVAIGNIFLERRAIIEALEINPLVVLERGSGVRAVDVRVVSKLASTPTLGVAQ